MGTLAGADNFPDDFITPDDGDDIEAGSVGIPFEALADRSIWLRNRSLKVITYTADTTLVAPVGSAFALANGYGGGGSGGYGSPGLNIADAYGMAGGGGGGAVDQWALIALIGGESYDIAIGDGGAAPIAVGNGNPGQASSVTRVTGGTVLCEFGGGGAGGGADAKVSATSTLIWMHLGGMPWADYNPADEWVGPNLVNPRLIAFLTTDPMQNQWPLPPGAGGPSVGRANGRPGIPQRTRSGTPLGAPGNGGSQGAHSGTSRGGGGGGGGGAGPGGNGGDGGAGGNGNSAGAAGNGTAGQNAAPNSGAGGGGGGAGGAGNSAPNNGTGMPGGAGGSGRMRLIIFGVKP